MKKFLLIVIAFSICSFTFLTAETAKIPSDLSKFSTFTPEEEGIGQDLESPVDGTVIKEIKSNGKTSIIIECKKDYFWKGKSKTCTYELIITNINDYQKHKDLKFNDKLGKISEDTNLLARCKTLDPYLVMGSNYHVKEYDNMYYFAVDFLMNTTDYLSYRQVYSLEKCAEDYLNKSKSELSDETEDNIFVLATDTDVDKINFTIKLDKFPEKLNNTEKFEKISSLYFGKNIWETYTILDTKNDYKIVICWQYDFKSYLEEEYQLNETLYIVGTFLAVDNNEKYIIFNARDFFTSSFEEIYEYRIQMVDKIEL